jgi:hypothetical protein
VYNYATVYLIKRPLFKRLTAGLIALIWLGIGSCIFWRAEPINPPESFVWIALVYLVVLFNWAIFVVLPASFFWQFSAPYKCPHESCSRYYWKKGYKKSYGSCHELYHREPDPVAFPD